MLSLEFINIKNLFINNYIYLEIKLENNMLLIKNPPLKSFRIDFKFNKPEIISLEMMAKVEVLLKHDYPNVPSIDIIEYPFDVPTKANFPIQIGPIKFLNEAKTGQIQFYSDGLIFVFTEYSSWNEIKESIIKILIELCEILKINEVEQFRMQYFDEFYFPSNDFELKNYFNLNSNYPSNWEIDYQDFHTGIKILTNEDHKYIIRLRGLPSKKEDNFFFRLESIYIRKFFFSIESRQELISELDEIHGIMDDYFINIMSEKLKQILGVEIK